MNITGFAAVTLIGLLAVISPGPDFMIVVRNSLLYGRKIGFSTALGISLGTILWVAMSLLGVSYAISKWVLLYNALKWIGSAYLVYLGHLGIKSFLASRFGKKDFRPRVTDGCDRKMNQTALSALLTGLFTNVLNPKAALFFVSFFSVILTPETPKIICAAYGLEISVIALVWFSLVATVLSVEKIKNVFEQVKAWLELVTGIVLISLGLKLAFSRSR